jgi:drug/metabolite transporter (DMT)-like permease
LSLTPRQSLLLVCLTLAWGFNWPVMKLGVTGFPPLSFRVLSMALGLPVLYAVTRWIGVDLRIPRRDWPELAKLTLTNMLIWHIVSILAVQALSSGRAAILGYTMPVFTALWGRALFGERLAPRQLAGIAAAAVGVGLLLWHELAQIAGRAGGALLMLSGAAVWGLGTQQMRRTTIAAPTLALSWWMSVITLGAVSVLAVILESDQWHLPPTGTWFAVGYNALLIFAAGLAGAGAHAATGRFVTVRHDDSGARGAVGRVVARRGAALAGRRGHRADGRGDRQRAVAGGPGEIGTVMRAPRMASGLRAAVRVLEAQPHDDLALARFHDLRIGVGLMIVALRMQGAVHQQMRVVRLQRQSRPARLLGHHRGAQDQVGRDDWLAAVVEGEHVGGVVAAAVVAVQQAALFGADDAHRDLRRALQCRADPARDAVARQLGAVGGVGELQRQRERRTRGHRQVASVRAAS